MVLDSLRRCSSLVYEFSAEFHYERMSMGKCPFWGYIRIRNCRTDRISSVHFFVIEKVICLSRVCDILLRNVHTPELCDFYLLGMGINSLSIYLSNHLCIDWSHDGHNVQSGKEKRLDKIAR